jgi:hypothetical protein
MVVVVTFCQLFDWMSSSELPNVVKIAATVEVVENDPDFLKTTLSLSQSEVSDPTITAN